MNPNRSEPRHHDTIVAVGTAAGEGGIAIVRISGPSAVTMAQRVFQTHSGQSVKSLKGFEASYGRVVDSETAEFIDEAVLLLMKAPKSYTREDVVEIQCHGGNAASLRILGLLTRLGCRLAEPGEFTRRAFMAGRIDLSQAEAVIDIIRSRTQRAARMAGRQLAGSLRDRLESIEEALADNAARLEAAVDFSDEDIEETPRPLIIDALKSNATKIDDLLAGAAEGVLVRSGVRVALMGRPNVGKSSLLNALLNRERAIVTAAPGTTRDTIEETISISGIPFILIDTAGVRSTEDEAEALGVAAARRAAAEADLILFVYEAPFGISPTDIEVVEIIAGKPHVYIANKLDMLDPGKTLASIQSANSETVFVSALTGEGIENLRGACVKAALGGSAPSTEDALVSSARHADALRRAAASVKRAKAALTEGLSEEFAATETRSAIRAIGEVTGSSIDETLLSRIFAEFCIGK